MLPDIEDQSYQQDSPQKDSQQLTCIQSESTSQNGLCISYRECIKGAGHISKSFVHLENLVAHDGARPHDDEGRGHAAGEDDMHDHQQISVPLSIYLRIDWRPTCSPFLKLLFKSNLSHQESLFCMHYVEEAAEKVHHDVKQRLGDNRPQLHEPGAVEALTVDEDNVSVEEDKEWTEHPVQKMAKKCARGDIF